MQTGRPFQEMLLLCAGQAVHDFITDMSPDATDDQIKNDLITGYSDLQGLSCKQAAYDSISQHIAATRQTSQVIYCQVQQAIQTA